MLIAPIVFCVVVLGIYGANDIKNGQSRCKTILYFEVVTSIALILGIIVAYVFKPGVGMNIDITHLDAKDLSTYTERAHDMHTGSEFYSILFRKHLLPLLLTAIFYKFYSSLFYLAFPYC